MWSNAQHLTLRLAASLALTSPLAAQRADTAAPVPPVAAPAAPRTPSPAELKGPSAQRLAAMADSAVMPPVYLRERFNYPVIGRPDPLQPPSLANTSTSLPEIKLAGIVVDEVDTGHSRAMLRFPGRTPPRRLIQVGDSVDQYVVRKIDRKRVTLSVKMLGGIRDVFLDRDSTKTPDSPPSERP